MQKALYSLCYDEMMRVCNRYVNDMETNASLYNDAMLKVFRNIDSYKDEGKIIGWVKRIVINTCIDFVRLKTPMPTIEIKETNECSAYGGNGVYLGGEYTKGKPVINENNFVQLEVFPNLAIDKKFKLLVGKEYENFLNDFQLINEDKDLDGLNSKVFSGCVRGICPWNTGIIMFDDKDNIWAAVTNLDTDKLTKIFYFTNDPAWTAKLPKTIENWVEDKRRSSENLQVIYKSKR